MLLALAGLEAPLQLPLGDKGLYGEDCVFIANDWHAALVPVYLAAKYRAHGVYKNARAIMAIHNLRHQVGLACCMYGSVRWGGGCVCARCMR
jgi:starch synthase